MMLWTDHQQSIARGRVLDIAQRSQRSSKAARQALGIARGLVDDTLQTVAGEHGHRRLAALEAALDRQGLPARPFLVLREAITELARIPEGSAIDLLRPSLADIADHEL